MNNSSRMRIPYIAKEDPHLEKYFRKENVVKHMRRAGLLDRHGDIVTEMQYRNRLENMNIAEANQQNRLDCIADVVKDLGRHHLVSTQNAFDAELNRLQVKLEQIQREFRRRNHRVVVRHKCYAGCFTKSNESSTADDFEKQFVVLQSRLKSKIDSNILSDDQSFQEIQHRLNDLSSRLEDLMANRTGGNICEDSSKTQVVSFDENVTFDAVETHQEEKLVKIGNKISTLSATGDPVTRSDFSSVKEDTLVMPHAEYQPSFDMFYDFQWK